jgi:hypothetical protein
MPPALPAMLVTQLPTGNNGISWVCMGIDGNSRISKDFRERRPLLFQSCSALIPLWISLLFPTRPESLLEVGKLGEQRVEIVPARSAEARRIEEIGVRDDDCAALADVTVGHQSAVADPAPAGEATR